MNHEAMCIPNQRGAVLAFSLVMLLLLTLVSVSMIQHNKQELAMTGNTLQQTKSLARAETELKQAEQEVSNKRLMVPADLTDRRCNSSDSSQLIKDQIILTTATGQATITEASCRLTGTAGTTGPRCTFTSGVCDATATCMCCNTGIEIYTLKWQSTADSNYGAQRTVESKYAVDCSGGQFP